jgi:hypothetical protein
LAAPPVGADAVLSASPAARVPCPGGEAAVTTVVVDAPTVVVIIVLAWPHIVVAVVASMPPVEALPLHVRHAVVLVKDLASLAVYRSPPQSSPAPAGR